MWCAGGEGFTARGLSAALIAHGSLTSALWPVREPLLQDTVLVP